jgi:hypothetical protein
MTRLEQWLSTLKHPIHIVGNGPLTIPPKDEGSVVRFNNFELTQQSGWRVTHWVTCAWQNVKDRPISNPLSPWTANCISAKYGRSFQKNTGKPLIFTATNNHILRWFPNASSKPSETWPSTGFCFLALLDYHGIRDVTIDGFNGLKNGHYWDPNHRHDHQTTAERELQIISSGFRFL